MFTGNYSNEKTIRLNKPQKRVYFVNPHWYVGIFSRGVGKSYYLQAIRSMTTAQRIPGGISCFYNATYIGAQQRTVSKTIAGWKSLGWEEGKDFVKNIKPPDKFDKNIEFEPLTWKNTISTKNGHVFVIGSNDRPGLVNSFSFAGGIFVDECRYIDEPQMKEDLYPAIRSNNIWGDNNPFFLQRTYTSDMPFITDESDWLFDFNKLMNPEQIRLIVAVAIEVEKLKFQAYQYSKNLKESDNYDEKSHLINLIDEINIDISLTNSYLDKIRSNYNGKKSTYFDTGSFISNINVLRKNYFFDNFNRKKPLISKVSFLNIKPEETENKFYSSLTKKHFITGTFDYDILDNGIPDSHDILMLHAFHILNYSKHIPVDVEFDFGDMCSCSISQTFGNEERYIGSFEVVFPDDIEDLVDIVNNFLLGHYDRRVFIYKDPSGNYMRNKKKQVYGQMVINRFKHHNWNVYDMCPIGSINPEHSAKHQLINMILSEKYPTFPKIRIIRETNKNLESSIKKAPALLVINNKGLKYITKDKSSEKELKLADKPEHSTDHSDHFDIKLWHKYNHLLPDNNIFL